MRIAIALLTLLVALFGALPTAHAARVEPKVVLIVGPAGAATDRYRQQAEQAARTAERYTSNVIRLYSPNATWPAVRKALDGAAIVVYMGHGNGWPSKYRDSLYGATQNGFGLNPVAGSGDYSHQYFGEDRIAADVDLARNAVVLLNHLCYASGNTEPGLPEGTVGQARQRVDNYAAGFIRAGAGAVVAEGHMGPAWYVQQLLSGSQSIDRIWSRSPNAHGNTFSFKSTRSPGFVASMDPDRRTSGFYRSIVYRGGVGGGQLEETPVVEADVANLEPTLVGSGLQIDAPYFKQRPLIGTSTELWIPYVTDDAATLKGLTVSVRWDPIDVDAAPPGAQGAAAQEEAATPDAQASPDPAASTEPAASPAPSAEPSEGTEPDASSEPGEETAAADPGRGRARRAPAAEAEAEVAPSADTSDELGAPAPAGGPPGGADPSVGRFVFIEPERTGSVVQPAAAKVYRSRLIVPLTVPADAGRYRLVATLHDASGVAYNRATQALVPGLLVRVSGEVDARYLVTPSATASAGGRLDLPVAVANVGASTWGHAAIAGRPDSRATHAKLVAHWVALDTADAETALPSDASVRLPTEFAPGNTQRSVLGLEAPGAPGTYLVVLDLVVPDVGSLTAQGIEPALVRVTVE